MPWVARRDGAARRRVRRALPASIRRSRGIRCAAIAPISRSRRPRVPFIAALDEALAARIARIDPVRGRRVASLAARLRGGTPAAAAADAPITRDAVATAVAAALGSDAIVFNEYWAPPARLARTRPQTYFYLSSAGGLGWALPAALGAQLAAPDRTVAALIGDGAYLFANPAACHHVAARYELPLLTVIYNNARWGAVDGATQSVYPNGRWRAAPRTFAIGPRADAGAREVHRSIGRIRRAGIVAGASWRRRCSARCMRFAWNGVRRCSTSSAPDERSGVIDPVAAWVR